MWSFVMCFLTTLCIVQFNLLYIFYGLVSIRFMFIFLFQFFGGTNFGRTSGGPNQITSYDYDAPIDEYGSLLIV